MASRATGVHITISPVGDLRARHDEAARELDDFDLGVFKFESESTGCRTTVVVTDETCLALDPTTSTQHGWLAPFTVVSGTVFLQCASLVFYWSPTCDIYNTEVPFILTLVTLLPLYICGWITAYCFGRVVAHLARFRRQAPSQFTFGLYCIVGFGHTSANDVSQVAWRCRRGEMKQFWYRIWQVSWFGIPTQWMLLAFLYVLRLRLMARVTPKTMRVSQVAFSILCVCYPVCMYLLYSQSVNVLYHFVFSVIACCYCTLVGCVAYSVQTSSCAVVEESSNFQKSQGQQLLMRTAESLKRAQGILTAAAASTLLYLVILIFESQIHSAVYRRLALSVGLLMDNALNSVAGMDASGLLGTKRGRLSVHIDRAVASVEARRFQQIERKLTQALGQSTGSALVIAALMGSVRPEDALAKGIARFRCVHWEVLVKNPGIIIGGAPLDVIGPGEKDLHSLSEPCRLGDCDAFFSHSWRDDGLLKWHALSCWCEQFKVEHGRFPRLWIDKICIDQSNIETDLQCLPVFLAGCNTIFAASGPTYPKRLWCLVEMLIYRAMLVSDPHRDPPVVWLLGETKVDREVHRQVWVDFSLCDCECFKVEDKNRILGVVAAYPGGIEQFEQFIREFAATAG